mgnify:CR=1 FL=1
MVSFGSSTFVPCSDRILPHYAVRQAVCRCKKSKCKKKYCDCFALGVGCNEKCECVSCANPKKGPARTAKANHAKPSASTSALATPNARNVTSKKKGAKPPRTPTPVSQIMRHKRSPPKISPKSVSSSRQVHTPASKRVRSGSDFGADDDELQLTPVPRGAQLLNMKTSSPSTDAAVKQLAWMAEKASEITQQHSGSKKKSSLSSTKSGPASKQQTSREESFESLMRLLPLQSDSRRT